MTIRRSPRPAERFLRIDNDVIDDPRLSLKSLGLLVKILRRPDNWKTDRESLARECKEGVTAIRNALTELRDAGYITQTKTQNDRGHWATETLVFDRPQSATGGGLTDGGKPTSGTTRQNTLFPHVAPAVENPTFGFPASSSTTEQELLLTTKNKYAPSPTAPDLFDEFWKTYPAKKGKLAARKAWAKALKAATAKEIIEGAVRYCSDVRVKSGFIKDPSTWLNGGHWSDEPDAPRLTLASAARQSSHKPFQNYADQSMYGDSFR